MRTIEPKSALDRASMHRIPVIDKMVEIFGCLEEAGDEGLAIGAIIASTRIPRSTVYRVLNTLAAHGIVARSLSGTYSLGFRLISLAARVRTEISESELVAIVQPHLGCLASATGETCKLSMLKELCAEVVAVEQSPNAMAPSSRVGTRFELHAGAASKLLLAFADVKLQKAVLSSRLERYTDRTITTADALQRELDGIRSSGVSFDRGEWNHAVHAIGSPIFNHAGNVIAALSATYFAASENSDVAERNARLITDTASAISTALGYRR